ncbi:hypothetical protein LTR64_001729 [Lithohypha guttulata]|uniref:uncharacterized protein n=1 Tax=Lithohypha guttulata TaxID=1690604 RepID=UPI002DDEB350|nr:hypothetical protein LTR51_003923 [Lithohypha guttulata]
MHFLQVLVVVAAAAKLVSANPLPQSQFSTFTVPNATTTSTQEPATATSTTVPMPDSNNPCAKITKLYLNATEFYPKVPSDLAWQCLNDVPLDAPAATIWLQSLRPYIEWQSTTAYLKDPPQGYLEPAVDVWAEFDNIVSGISAGRYANEYEFEFALYRLFQGTHDGHFRYMPTLANGIFSFGRPVSLISYSADGYEAPKPYVYEDVLSNFVNGTAKPSAVTQIDGKEAIQFLEEWSQYGSLQDPDALYNNLFYGLAQASLGASGSGPGTFAGGGRGAYIYPGPTTSLTFENGSTHTHDNFARVQVPFRYINNGSDLYLNYVNSPLPSSTASNRLADAIQFSAPATATSPTVYPRPGYPPPVVNSKTFNNVAGYYLDEPGYEDVAVLAVASFVGTSDYQNVVYSFLDQASKAGKTKLVIDTSANGGGTIMQGYNLFLNLFPGIVPYGATRFRSHEAFNLIGETVSERMFYYPFDYHDPPNWVWNDFAGGVPFNYRADVDVNYTNFDSWQDKNPPSTFMGDDFTSVIRWNLSDPLIYPANQVQPNGYGNRTGLPPTRPFEPENIVILYDGYCASTCAIFSELMTQQIGIKTVSIGGRPNGRHMQTVGGVKGTNNYPWYFISQLVTDTYTLAPDQASFFNTTALYDYIDPDTDWIPYHRAVGNSGQVNVRDGLREGDETQTPLQFIYEAADCRLYYTAEMTVDVTAMWEKVVDVTWNGDSCVVGGISGQGHAQSKRFGEDTSDAVKARAQAKAKRRLQKRRRQMTASRIAAIKQSLDIVTDSRNIQPIQGLMLP